jgi:ABC-type branched-subunit amino acid transport system permease subunit
MVAMMSLFVLAYIGEPLAKRETWLFLGYASLGPLVYAVGGRATLIGPIVGAFLVNGAKSWLTVTAPEFWLYFLGALFIGVTLFLPQGVVGFVQKIFSKRKSEDTP